jgi:hypothetical protein
LFGADPGLARAFAEYDAREQAERARAFRARSAADLKTTGETEATVTRMDSGRSEARPMAAARAVDRETGPDNVVHIGDLRPGQPSAPSMPQASASAGPSMTSSLRQALARVDEEPLPRMFAGDMQVAAAAPDADSEATVRLEPADEPRVDVTLRERTVTFSVPATDARLPDGLSRITMDRAAEQRLTVDSAAEQAVGDDAIEPTVALPAITADVFGGRDQPGA